MISRNHFSYFAWLALFPFMFIGSGCTDSCETEYTYIYYEPVYSTTQEVRDGFNIIAPTDLETPGKIYLYGQYILINEPGKGIHILNNTDKRNPVNERFIAIPGNFDMAVKDNILYADSYIDLLAIDISDLNNVTLLNRLENAFPNYNTQFGFIAESGMVITDWEEIRTVEMSEDCTGGGGLMIMERGIFVDFAMADALAGNVASPASSSPSTPSGQAGSMARFALHNDFLYGVDSWEINVFDITNRSEPKVENRVNIGWGVETIFPYKDHLFIGSESGMFIFDNSDPSSPRYQSSFMHMTACDPVVVNDDYAFITLRSGNQCQGFTNQLDVVDIKNLNNPFLVKTYPMNNPYGLGIDGNTLFLCEGEFGLKVFDIEDINSISDNELAHFPDIHAFDVIPYQKVLLMIGEDGFYQYDYSDVQDIKLLSHIVVTGGEL